MMVANAEAVEEVLFGDKGVVKGLPQGAAMINMGTIGAVATTRIAEKLDDLRFRMLDAPVAGSTPVAAAENWTSWSAPMSRPSRNSSPSSRRWERRSRTWERWARVP